MSYELALLAQGRRAPDAPAQLERAVDELERVGNLPAAATARRELGVALLRAGQRDAGT